MKRTLTAMAAALFVGAALCASAEASRVDAITIEGSINPVSSSFIQDAIARGSADGAVAVLVELDTPGGLVSSTKDIIQSMLNADVPVIVYVGPRGAWAASAGTFITLAAHVAAMAPGTTIGAASPVSVGGTGDQRGEGEERTDVAQEKSEQVLMAFIESIAKQRNRNVDWAISAVRKAEAITDSEALELGVIDVVADNRRDLLAQIDGMEVEVAGDMRVLEVANAQIRELEMDWITKMFNFLADPQIAYLLGMAGLLGLYIEFNNPGLIVPGVLGAVCLMLTGIALQILPFSWVGLLMLLAGMGLMFAEMFVSAFGLLLMLGVGCFLIGGSMVFDMPDVGDLTIPFWSLVFPVAAGFGLFAAVVVFAVGRSKFRKQTAGVSELLGLEARATTDLGPDGKVFVRGEYWNAVADESISEGEIVVVTEVKGLRLFVRRRTSES
ncbi:nodulation protein NfeD [Myxococcota bacterium]|nr:nodulation protein NfeD [Myxococcota bacterium]